MNLQTSWLGLKLKNPLVVGASPLVDDLDTVRALEDAGAGAITMRSLFEEQITLQQEAEFSHLESPAESFPEAASYFPAMEDYALGPDRYLNQIERIRQMVSIPVIGSLNGISPGGWVRYAKWIEDAGADALELNFYFVPTDARLDASTIEKRLIELVQQVRAVVKIPLAVKLSPFYSSPANLARQLDEAGVQGLVLFNRFYQPDVDIEELVVKPHLQLSDPSELRLRLRWLAIIFGQIQADLAVTGGVHGVSDIVKSMMCGARSVQIVSTLLLEGPSKLDRLLSGLREWMEEFEYESVEQMCGSMSLQRSPDPSAFERANYLKILQLWQTGGKA